ncbi:hypothetical protein Xen7305DRAFT_00052840 [Xenococcus sp. PCC 7305]|nr:hypothetical protein Xen7305DRAFT_00052840 [Xenococcus sp. PCC 7305]
MCQAVRVLTPDRRYIISHIYVLVKLFWLEIYADVVVKLLRHIFEICWSAIHD